MNCADFETIVNQLADNRPLDATARVNGLSHVTVCGECANRLREQRALSAGLRAALAAETAEAPARVRESLLASFAVQQQQAATPSMASLGAASHARHWWWAASAVAAAAAIILGVMLLVKMQRSSFAPSIQTAETQPNGVQPAAVKPAQKPAEQVGPKPDERAIVANDNLTPKRPRPTRRPLTTANGNRSETVASTTTSTSGNQFIPLTYLASATAMESGTVVRVRLSRATLIGLGLPVNAEHADEFIRADLVLGDDGVARAIRLVE